MAASQSLAVVVPMANESATAAQFLRGLLDQLDQLSQLVVFVVLDNASNDGTLEIVTEFASREPRVNVVWAPENRSVVDAYMRGYREALASNSDLILEIDAGFSHSPKEISGFLQAMADGYDCAFGSRFVEGATMINSGWARYLTSKGGTIVTNLLIGTRLHDMTSGFQMFRRDALEMILANGIRSRGPFFQTEMKIYARHMRICEIPISYHTTESMVRQSSISDAFSVLWELFVLRMKGTLAPAKA